MSETTLSPAQARLSLTASAIGAVVAAWFAAVLVAAGSGALAQLDRPLIAALVAVSIIMPVAWYFSSPSLRALVETVGHRRIALFHAWRVPAALLFFWYGAQGALPPAFWILAGVGDLIAGVYALRVASGPESLERYRGFHRFGFADFVVAVGTGLLFTLLDDPRMATIAVLPMAVIPLFGVGLSGATHLMAFDMLRRRVGLRRP
jgi:hypothetical protein